MLRSGVVSLLLASRCATGIPREALQLSPESLGRRELQSRRFVTADERSLLIAAAGLLQDMGYVIEESAVPLGVVVGQKDRDATEGGQVFGAVMLSALFGGPAIYDVLQKIRASLVTHVAGDRPGELVLRVTFQRIVWNNQGAVSKLETIDDVAIYEQFFAALGKAVFLEAHKL